MELTIYNGGQYVNLKNSSGAIKKGGPRGTCKGFTPASRRRALRSLFKIDQRELLPGAIFITLTYPRDYTPYVNQTKRHLLAYLKRLQRLRPQSFVFWRHELQQRGAPHFHLIWYFPEGTRKKLNLKAFQRWTSRAWYDIVGSQDPDHLAAGTNCKKLKNLRQATYYVSKYVAKHERNEAGEDPTAGTGRQWGIFMRENQPINPSRHQLRAGEFFRMRRILKRFIRAKLRQLDKEKGKQPRSTRYRTRGVNGLSCYLSAAAAHSLLHFIAEFEIENRAGVAFVARETVTIMQTKPKLP